MTSRNSQTDGVRKGGGQGGRQGGASSKELSSKGRSSNVPSLVGYIQHSVTLLGCRHESDAAAALSLTAFGPDLQLETQDTALVATTFTAVTAVGQTADPTSQHAVSMALADATQRNNNTLRLWQRQLWIAMG